MPKCERRQLTQPQIERFGILSEECGEVVQVCGKIFRHGLDSTNPLTNESNKDLLEKELGDIFAAVALLEQNNEVSTQKIFEYAAIKVAKLLDPDYPFVHFQAE